MKSENTAISERKFTISYFINEQIEFRNWSHDLLLEKLGVSKDEFYKIIENDEPISELFGRKLATVFSTSTEYWINLDTIYKKWYKHKKKQFNFSLYYI